MLPRCRQEIGKSPEQLVAPDGVGGGKQKEMLD